jgi:hypothetical protein
LLLLLLEGRLCTAHLLVHLRVQSEILLLPFFLLLLVGCFLQLHLLLLLLRLARPLVGARIRKVGAVDGALLLCCIQYPLVLPTQRHTRRQRGALLQQPYELVAAAAGHDGEGRPITALTSSSGGGSCGGRSSGGLRRGGTQVCHQSLWCEDDAGGHGTHTLATAAAAGLGCSSRPCCAWQCRGQGGGQRC